MRDFAKARAVATDFALVDDDSGELTVHKTLTTPDDPSEAVLWGLEAMLARDGVDIGALASVIHGTTLVTNAVIERTIGAGRAPRAPPAGAPKRHCPVPLPSNWRAVVGRAEPAARFEAPRHGVDRGTPFGDIR